MWVIVWFQKMERYSSYPVYHSVYDTFEIVEKFYDPNFKRLRAVAQVRGGLVFLLADSQLLPLDVNQYADSLRKYTESISQLAQRHPQEMNKFKVSFGEKPWFYVLFIETYHKHPGIWFLSSCYGVEAGWSWYCFLSADALFSAVENFTLTSRDFTKRLHTLNRGE